MDRHRASWVEVTGTLWELKATGLAGSEHAATLILSGRYSPLTGPDFPTPSVNGRRVAFGVAHHRGVETMDSQIIVVDLELGMETVVASLQSPDQYLGPSSLSGNPLTYLNTGVTTPVDKPDGIAMITPMVSNGWLVWVQYDVDHKENKNVFALRLNGNGNDELRQLTFAAAGGFEEYSHPIPVPPCRVFVLMAFGPRKVCH